MKIAIVTDSNSGVTQQMANELGVHVIPMPFMIDGEDYYEDINLTQEDFYRLLGQNAEVSTSQPAIADVLDCWDSLLEEYDEIVHLPMSSGLSGACDTAVTLSRDYGGRVQVVDNHRISVTLQRAVEDALSMTKKGFSARQIKEYLENTQADASIYIMVDTMKYLKKGGRVTAAAATVGAVLNIKPVLQIAGGKLDAFAKPRGQKAACQTMIDAMRKDLDGRLSAFSDRLQLYVAYTFDREAAERFAAEVEESFGMKPLIAPLPLSVSCHIGPGALALAAATVENN